MAMAYTEEQRNQFDRTTLVQLLLEQVAVLNNHRFGKSSEKLDMDNQLSFLEKDGQIVFFNECKRPIMGTPIKLTAPMRDMFL